MSQQNIRNIAVIAHVDHGKTTLVDALLKQTHVFRENQEEMGQTCILDSNDLERERGITILAKNCAVNYKGVKINIIDTPGHADFSGEVERTLGMADGALLIIDAQEGPMPQTRFVLKKALNLGLKIVVVINKIDKKYARPQEVLHKTETLFLELAQSEDQLNFPVLYAIGRRGVVFTKLPEKTDSAGNVLPLLDTIVENIPAPKNKADGTFKMQVASLDYDPHLGRIAIGKIFRGTLKKGDKVLVSAHPETFLTINQISVADGLSKSQITEAAAGEIVSLAGLNTVKIGDTLATRDDPESLPALEIGEPTIHLTLGANTSPFAGQEGQFTTSRQLENRLDKELETNLSLRVEKLPSGQFKLSGRGELHLSVLLETMRREGYEMEVGKPEVIFKTIDGVVQEPIEEASIIVPQDYIGVVNQELGKRYANLVKSEPLTSGEIEFIYELPTRAILGLRSLLLTLTKGTGVFSSQLVGFQPVGRAMPKLRMGVLIAAETGQTLAYGLDAAQGRGSTFFGPGVKVYEGMIIGQNTRPEDIAINVCKGKKLTNMRSKASDGIIQLDPPVVLSLEQSLDFLEEDELLEITPLSLRLRKKYLTDLDRRRERRSH